MAGLGKISNGAMTRTCRHWPAPMAILLLTLGLILVVTEGSALAPFIYSLF
jgi:hypothetical protein